MESLYPRTATHPVTEEGKAIHWASEGVMRSWLPVNDLQPRTLAEYLGHTCPENGVVITEEMVAAGNVYLACVWERAQLNLPGLQIEKQLSAWHAGLKSSGRCDSAWVSTDDTWLTIWDFKYGNKAVDVFENWQLFIYGLAGAHRKITTVELVIVQPRGQSMFHPIKRWRLDRDTLERYARWVRLSAALADKGEAAPTHAGKWCRYCRAAHSCDTLAASGWGSVDRAGNSVPINLTPAEIVYELEQFERAGNMLRARLDAIKGLAVQRIAEGVKIPGYFMERGLSNREWRDESTATGLGRLFGVDMEDRKVIGPKQAEVRGIPPLAVNALTVRHERPPQLKKGTP